MGPVVCGCAVKLPVQSLDGRSGRTRAVGVIEIYQDGEGLSIRGNRHQDTKQKERTGASQCAESAKAPLVTALRQFVGSHILSCRKGALHRSTPRVLRLPGRARWLRDYDVALSLRPC